MPYSIRDIYPNLSRTLSTREETIPEREEMRHYNRAEVEEEKTETKKPADTWSYLIWFVVGIVFLAFIGVIDLPYIEGI